MKVSIRQPGYLPYTGFFKKIQYADIFVFLDDVQYERGDYDNRNKIRMNNEAIWLTVPVLNDFGQKLNEVWIRNDTNWKTKHKKAIELNYQKTFYFNKYWKDISVIYDSNWNKLLDLNYALIDYFIKQLDIKTKTIKSSEMDIKTTKSQRLLDICKKLGATEYISGIMGRDYLDESIFKKEGIDIIYENFEHPVYNQIQYNNFIPYMSVIDLFLNTGPEAKRILEHSKIIKEIKNVSC